MTVSALSASSGPFVGNALATIFPFTFKAETADEIQVLVDGVVSAGYTATISAVSEGGSVTFTSPPANGAVILIVSNPSFAQEIAFENAGQFLPSSHDDANDRAAIRDIYLKACIARSILAPWGENLDALPPSTDRAGNYLAFDAQGQPVLASGTGTDTSLRTDLSADTGDSLIGTAFGMDLRSFLLASAMRPVRGIKGFSSDRNRAVAAAIAMSDPATTPIWGFAKYAGTNGGFGKTESVTYDPEGDGTPNPHTIPFVRFVSNDSDDVTVPGSFRWALDAIHTNGGGYVIVHPRGKIEPVCTSPIYYPSNLTFAAPGRNFTLRSALNQGLQRFYGPGGGSADYGLNIILWGIKEVMEGGGAIVGYDQKPGEVDALAAVPSYGSNKIAIYECEISGATDGAFDIAGGVAPGAPVYLSILKTAFRNTDKTMAVGIGTASTLSDSPLVYVTVGQCHFEGCSQRKVMSSNRAFVHVVNCVDDAVPHYRDYSEGSSIGSFSAANVRGGGRLRYEANIVRLGDPALTASSHEGVADTAGNAGAALLTGNYFQPGILNTVSIDAADVPALPGGYTYPLLTVTADPDTVAQQIIAGAGAGRTNWPDGLYAPVDQTTGVSLALHVNGESVLWHDDHYWVRVSESYELPYVRQVDAFNIARGSSLTIASGAITLLDDRVFAVSGEGGLTDDLTTINLTTDTDYVPITGGLIFIRPSSGATAPITIKAGGNISTQHNIVLDNSAQWACLLWNGTNAWDVLFEPTRLLAKFDHFADVGNGTTVETDLYSDSIVANRLNTNGDKLKAEYGGIFVAHATATRQLKVYFGGTAIFDSGASATTTAETWTVAATIIRVSASVVRYKIDFSATTSTGAGLPGITKVGELTGLTLSNANVLKITGTAAAAGAATNDIVAKLGTVIFVPAA